MFYYWFALIITVQSSFLTTIFHRNSPDALYKTPRLFRSGTKPIRDASFWLRALHIYSSYKLTQVKNGVKRRVLRRSVNANQTWAEVHDVNSSRMMRLCLGLRGFYLKTGQFLGTRYDFMPPNYTRKLSRLHDDVPPESEAKTREVIERELGGPIEQYFASLDLAHPIGCASIAQVHQGVWRQTGEKVAVKVQHPRAEALMHGDLRNLRRVAEFLQKTELQVDLLSAIVELQKQIGNEFDFVLEARNMDRVRRGLLRTVPEVAIPRPLWSSRRLLVMTFIEGLNLGRTPEFRDKAWGGSGLTRWAKQRFAHTLLRTLARAWGEQIFTLHMFNADPHPGNICLGPGGRVGLLDWGQVKRVPRETLLHFSEMVCAISGGNSSAVVEAFFALGVRVTRPQDRDVVHKIALTMLDTRSVPGFKIDPFGGLNTLRANAVTHMPADLYFLVRAVQLLRGVTSAFDLEYSLADQWAPLARQVIAENRSHTLRMNYELE